MTDTAPNFVDWLNARFIQQGAEVEFRHDGHSIAAHGFGVALGSAFQPIIGAVSGRTLGWEGLVRPRNQAGQALPVAAFLDNFATGNEMARVDRICRSLHLANFVRAAPSDGYLFLNLHPRHLLSTRHHGEVFARIAEAANVPPQRIVMEILEHKTSDEAQLAEAVKALKARGFLIALDDFGQEGHSVHYDRLTALKPNIVKFDRSLIAGGSDARQYLLRRLVGAVHALGATVVAEGVETDIEATMAREAGVDMLQGYLIGRPLGTLSEGRLPEGATAPVSSCASTHTYAHISAMP